MTFKLLLICLREADCYWLWNELKFGLPGSKKFHLIFQMNLYFFESLSKSSLCVKSYSRYFDKMSTSFKKLFDVWTEWESMCYIFFFIRIYKRTCSGLLYKLPNFIKFHEFNRNLLYANYYLEPFPHRLKSH